MQLPPPPVASFASDNAAGVAPEVIDALVAANVGAALAYGDDPWTKRLDSVLADLFGRPVTWLACWGGTGANVVGISSVVQPWQTTIASDAAHIVVDECGAPARFSGATITPVPHRDGKLTAASIEPYRSWLGVEHHPQPALVSVSQTTEYGTCYLPGELGALAEAAHRDGLLLHVDGARISNAVAATATGLPAMIVEAGVDLMTFGLTKNGAMYGELVVYLRPDLARNARFVRKQAGQLPSKTRFVAAQAIALLEDGLWLRNAAHANAMATRLVERLAAVPTVQIVTPTDANAVFARLPAVAIEPLREWSFFWDWDPADSVVRWMTSFATTEADVDTFADGVAAVIAAA